MGIFTRSKKKAETEKVEVHNAPPMPTKPKQAEINPSVVQANVPLNQLIVGGPLAVVLVVGVVMGLFYAFFYVGVIIGIAVILFGIANAMAQQEGKNWQEVMGKLFSQLQQDMSAKEKEKSKKDVNKIQKALKSSAHFIADVLQDD